MALSRPARMIILAMLAATAVLAASCTKIQRPVTPLNLTVKGTGRVTPVEIPPEPEAPSAPTTPKQQTLAAPQWTSGTAEASADISLSQEASSYVEGVVLARQQAVDFVEQQLTGDIGKLKIASGQTVGEIAQGDVSLRNAFAQKIRDAKIIKDAEQGGKYEFSARIDLKEISDLLQAQGVQTADAPTTIAAVVEQPKVNEIAFQKEAYNLALENARSQMREVLKQQFLKSGERIGERMAKDESASQTVETAINNAIITDVKFTEGRECQLAATLDPSKLIELLNMKDKRR